MMIIVSFAEGGDEWWAACLMKREEFGKGFVTSLELVYKSS